MLELLTKKCCVQSTNLSLLKLNVTETLLLLKYQWKNTFLLKLNLLWKYLKILAMKSDYQRKEKP